jgi:sarcosine oxidase subunit gamma
MNTPAILPARLSPVHGAMETDGVPLITRNRMAVSAAPTGQPEHAPPVWLRDASHRFRFGFKGAGAPAWCGAQGLPLPASPNTFALLEGGGAVARLAYTEFYVEHEDESVIAALRSSLGKGARAEGGGVYPVHRCDAGIVLGGPLAQDVLLQTCNVNFGALDAAAMPVVMTLMVGVAVTVLPMLEGGQPVYRMACDPTFAPYLWRTLSDIVAECGSAMPPA